MIRDRPEPTAAPGQPAGGQPVLSAQGVGMRYPNGTLAIEGLSLDLARGEFVSLVGTSGCGKSTFLRLVAGLERETGGRLDFPTGARPEVGFVFQHPTLLPWRTVEANVALAGELGRSPRRIGRERVAGLLGLVGLEGFARAYPRELSGGMQMRVSLARALAGGPGLLLLDEPFGALDEITRQRLNEELLALWMREGWSALFVTHSVFEAVFLSTRVVVMTPRPGRVAAEFQVPFPYPRGPELRARPEYAALCGEVSARLREVAG